jgi:hypothetical protein
MQASPKVDSQRNHYLKQHLAEAEAEAERRRPDTIESCLVHSFSDWRIRDTRRRRHLTLQGLDMSIASSRRRQDTHPQPSSEKSVRIRLQVCEGLQMDTHSADAK